MRDRARGEGRLRVRVTGDRVRFGFGLGVCREARVCREGPRTHRLRAQRLVGGLDLGAVGGALERAVGGAGGVLEAERLVRREALEQRAC